MDMTDDLVVQDCPRCNSPENRCVCELDELRPVLRALHEENKKLQEVARAVRALGEARRDPTPGSLARLRIVERKINELADRIVGENKEKNDGT